MKKDAGFGKVTESERQEIEFLFERINSLESLSLTLAANNDLYKEKSDMLESIISDLSNTRKKFNQWWERIADKYNLDKNSLKNYRILFQDGSLFLQADEVILGES